MAKVIGLVDPSTYIIEVGHSELEKFLKMYYKNLGRLQVGQHIDLKRSHEFEQDIRESLENTQQFILSNKKIIESILNGISIVAINNGEEK
jgi:hypothetical protein